MRLEDGRRSFREIAAAGYPAEEYDQFKLERLLELRAVIDTLRHEHYSSPPADRVFEHDPDSLP